MTIQPSGSATGSDSVPGTVLLNLPVAYIHPRLAARNSIPSGGVTYSPARLISSADHAVIGQAVQLS